MAFTKVFFRGLAALLPIALTLYVVWWLAMTAEEFFKTIMEKLGLEIVYFWGLGILLAVGFTCLIGLLMYSVLVRWLYNLGVSMLERIPMVKTIYGMLKDIMGFFSVSERKAFGQVVMVKMPDGSEVIGFVTREDASGLRGDKEGDSDTVAVYVPMSYQIGGFLLLVERERIRPLDMGIEKAMRLVITAGVATDEGKDDTKEQVPA